MNAIFLNINRIVLNNPGLTPERAEHIRQMAESELQRLLEREGLPDNITGSHISSLKVQAMNPEQAQSDMYLASSLAQSISRALHGI